MSDSAASNGAVDNADGRPGAGLWTLGRILARDPGDAERRARYGAIVQTLFNEGRAAFAAGRLTLAAWSFSLLADHASPREGLRADLETIFENLLIRALDAEKAGRIEDGRRIGRLILALDPAHAMTLLALGVMERGSGSAEDSAVATARGLRLDPHAGGGESNRASAILAATRELADRLRNRRPTGRLLTALARLDPAPGPFLSCRDLVERLDAGSGEQARDEHARRCAEAEVLQWMGAQHRAARRYRDALDCYDRASALYQSPAGLERQAEARQYQILDDLLETLKAYGSAYLHDMTGQEAARVAFDGVAATMERLLEVPNVDHWTRTQLWTGLLGLRALVGYAGALGRNPLGRLSGNPFDPAADAAALPVASPSRRIFDCCTFFNEVEVLEIRLRELYDVVERFVVVEATHTHSGQPKALTFGDHRERFRPYLDKITYVVADELVGHFSWQREAYQRDCILRGLGDCRDDDMIIVSDVDEILRCDVVERLRGGGEAFDTVFSTELDLFFYRLNYRFGRDWRAAGAAPFRFVKRIGPNAVRYLAKQSIGHLIPDAGWHLSWMGDLDRFNAKLKAYAHQEHAEAYGATTGNGERMARFLEDGRGVPGGCPGAEQEHEIVTVDERHPRLVLEQLDRFREMGWVR